MTCRDLVTFLLEYLSGELPPEERTRFEEHIAECEACVAYLATYEQTIQLGKAAFREPADPVPADVPERLVQTILAAARTRPS